MHLEALKLVFQIRDRLSALGLFGDLANNDLPQELPLGVEALLLLAWCGIQAKACELSGSLIELRGEGFNTRISRGQVLAGGIKSILQ